MTKSKKQEMTYDNISVRQYIAIQKVILEDSEPLNLMRNIIMLVSGNDIFKMSVSDANEIMDQYSTMLSTKLENKEVTKKLYVDGQKCIVTDLNNMTLAQFMDYQELIKDVNGNLLEILAICIVPYKATYNDNSYDMDEFKEKLAELPITTVIGIVNFQLARLQSLYRSSLAYLTAETLLTKPENKLIARARKLSLKVAWRSMGF